MNPNREEALFAQALEKPAAERAAFLKLICGEDEALRQRLEALLTAHEQPDAALTTAAPVGKQTIKLDLADAPDEAVGQTLGRYKLLERVGEGGCGVVYVAEQTEPVRRRVALKVIKLGMDTKQVVARFEAERQALAMMDHPNIAKVLDAGTTDVGRPYFVMELVRGIRITDYCDQDNLPTQERLDLFIKVCQAIQHAHQKGIIHRDIKPSNILVTLHDGVPVPKVIDFGIAKATEGRLTDATVYTQLHQFIGTPAYMSPEQAEMSGLDIDTRSDIYSLGVLLYELLTGKTPFDAHELMSQGIDAMRKTIREIEPVRPSTRLATLRGDEQTTTAKRHAMEMPRLIHQLRGDLDWIVMKCLEKDRTRRYDTANGVAMDLKRHLQNEPVVARPPSTAYRLQKAWRRNQLAFGAGIAVAVALVFGILAATWQAVRATRAEREQARLRNDAVAAKTVAEQAQAREQKQREQAEATELLARRTAYASDMNLVQQALAANNLGRAQALLDRHRPPPASNAPASKAKSQSDLRDWEWRYLWSQTRPEEHEVLWRGTNRMRRLSYSADGKWLAFESGARAIIMDVVSQKIVLQQQRSYKPVFANRARLLAYEDYGYRTNAAIVLWDTAQRREIRRLPDPGYLMHVVFSADDQRLLVVSPQLAQAGPGVSGLLLSSWDVATGMLVWQKPIGSPQTGVGRTFAVSPDGTAVAAAVRTGRLQVLETRDGAERFSLKATEEAVTSLAFSPDGKTLVSGAGFTDSTIKLWDALKGTALDSLEGHRSWVCDLAFTPDGSRLISASGDQTIRLWDWSTRQPAGVLRGHLGEVEGLAVAPDGRTLASGCKDGTVYLWELDRPAAHPAYRTLTGRIRTGVFTADSKSILGIESRGGLALWDVPTLQESRRLRENSTTNSPFPIIAPDASRIAFVEPDGGLRLLDLKSGLETVTQLPGERVGGGLFTRNGNYFVSLRRGRTNDLAKVWDARTWVSTGSFPIRLNDLSVAVPRLPNSLLLTRGDTLQLWDVAKPGEPPREMVNAGGFYDFDTSPDGRIAAGAFESGHVQLWDLATLQPLETLKGFLLGAHSVTFSPDGKRIAAGSNGQEAVKFWDVETRQEVLTLKGEGSVFQTIAFSTDGNSLMAINAGGVCHIWSAPSFDEIAAAEPEGIKKDQQR